MLSVNHFLVGRKVVYVPKHGDREEGKVTSVDPERGYAFVRYPNSETSQLTPLSSLQNLDGSPVDIKEGI